MADRVGGSIASFLKTYHNEDNGFISALLIFFNYIIHHLWHNAMLRLCVDMQYPEGLQNDSETLADMNETCLSIGPFRFLVLNI